MVWIEAGFISTWNGVQSWSAECGQGRSTEPMKVSKVCFVVSNNDQELQQKGNREKVGHGGESHGSQKDFGSQENQDHQWLGH